ncbi:unnamed protein product [Brachionus calyciflorus]|uniref:Uncharacterized protein n=1 Tax=Brachionus calyciflorus TaxID=104777 RepID=A0A814MG48_9BILA|nr:unnamed protein product [Brachionus calyciflorus]
MFLVSYTNKDLNSYAYQKQLQSLFGFKTQNYSLDSVWTVKNIWQWSRTYFVPAFKNNAYDSNVNKFMIDNASFIIGKPIMRQNRIKNETCRTQGIEKKLNINTCFDDFGLLNQEKSFFDVNWSNYNPNISSKYSEFFKYRSSSEVETYPYLGKYYNFFGGGYVYTIDYINNTTSVIFDDLVNLEELKWIDQHTRGIFFEFQVYNPNLNLFAYCTILFEIIPTGKIIPSVYFEPVILFEPLSGFAAFVIAINVIFLIFILMFMIKEIRLIIKEKSNYFKKFWNYIEWLIFVFTWFTFAIYLYRLYAKNDLFEKLKNNKIIKLQLLCYWNGIMAICLGFLSFFASLKFLKLLRFNRKIQEFMVTLKLSLNDLVNFSLVFVICWSAFAQIIYLILFDDNKSFSTIIASFEATFLMTLNKLYKDIYIGSESVLIGIITIFFYVFVVFTLLGLFITIITENFAKSSKFNDTDEQSKIVKDFLKEKFQRFIKLIKNEEKKINSKMDKIDEYEQKINEFLIMFKQLEKN